MPKPPWPTPSTPPPAVEVGSSARQSRQPLAGQRTAPCFGSSSCTRRCAGYGATSNAPGLPLPPLTDAAACGDPSQVMLVVSEGRGRLSACVLNRPTANAVEFRLLGRPRRRLPFCGSSELSGKFGGQLWLSHRRDLGGVAVGGSGVFRLSGGEAAAKLQSGLAAPSDLLLVSGAVEFERAELAGMLSAGEARLVLPDSRPPTLWERAWSLSR